MDPTQALVVALSFTLLAPATGCSFIVSNFPVNASGNLTHVNFFNVRRGPDATNIHRSEDGWHFVHNLLSMTGAVTLQPFISDDGGVVALFNGEIYNFRRLAAELEGARHAYRSDGFAILPAYARWGREFVQHLEGEFAIVLVDFGRREVILSTDVFSTKPLWYAIWDEEPTAAGSAVATPRRRFVAASYESVLVGLGAPATARRMANANEALVLRLPRRQDSGKGTSRQQHESRATSVEGRQLQADVSAGERRSLTLALAATPTSSVAFDPVSASVASAVASGTHGVIGQGLCVSHEYDYTRQNPPNGVRDWGLHEGIGWRFCNEAKYFRGGPLRRCYLACQEDIHCRYFATHRQGGCCFLFRGEYCKLDATGRFAAYTTFDASTQIVTWNKTDLFWEHLCPAAPPVAAITTDAEPSRGRQLGEQVGRQLGEQVGGGALEADAEEPFGQLTVLPLVTWDLRQHKTDTRDWAAAFRRAVAVRTRGIKHRVFIGLSSGYDSGAIMLALKEQVRMPVPPLCMNLPYLSTPLRPHPSGVRSGWHPPCLPSYLPRYPHGPGISSCPSHDRYVIIEWRRGCLSWPTISQAARTVRLSPSGAACAKALPRPCPFTVSSARRSSGGKSGCAASSSHSGTGVSRGLSAAGVRESW